MAVPDEELRLYQAEETLRIVSRLQQERSTLAPHQFPPRRLLQLRRRLANSPNHKAATSARRSGADSWPEGSGHGWRPGG
jgi:hypothetical protein